MRRKSGAGRRSPSISASMPAVASPSGVVPAAKANRTSNSGGTAASGEDQRYLERRDPDFETKMRDVLIVYQDVDLQNEKRAAGEPASSVITVPGG